jgi:hypothetical protein
MLFLLIIQVVQSYNCKFKLSSGEEYDFSPLMREIPDYEADSMDFVYRFNICIDTAILCNGEFSIASQWNYYGGCISVLARQGPEPPVLSKKDDNLVLTYKNGDYCYTGPRKVNYIFHCSNKKTKIGLVEEPEACIYNFDIYSKYTCFDSSSTEEEIETAVSWLFLLSLAVFFGYFFIGFMYNKMKDKTLSTTEAIPHFERITEILSSAVSRFRH